MKIALTAFVSLATMASTLAFTSSTSFITLNNNRPVTKVFAENQEVTEKKQEGSADITNFDGVNLVRLLGLKRVKKMERRFKRERNQAQKKQEK